MRIDETIFTEDYKLLPSKLLISAVSRWGKLPAALSCLSILIAIGSSAGANSPIVGAAEIERGESPDLLAVEGGIDKVWMLIIAFLLIGFGTTAAFAQESGSATAVGGPPQVLNGELRWKKALGTVPIVAGLSAAHSDPCSAFHVLVVTATEEQALINYADKLVWKPKIGGFNVCEFRMTVASNTPIRVYAEMGKKDGSTEQQDYLYLHGGWSGGEKIPYDSLRYGWQRKGMNFYPGNLIDPQPETGYKRSFRPTYHEITLGPAMASFISFEMVYADNRFEQYPKYREAAPPPLKAPFITASKVPALPYTQYPSVYLSWDGGPDHPHVEVWVSINNGAEIPAFSLNFPAQHPIFKQPKVAGIEMKLQQGGLYKYILKDGGTTLSAVSLVVP